MGEPLRKFEVTKPLLPRQFYEVYDDADFVIEVNTPFAALKSSVLAAVEASWLKHGKRCQAWRDAYCGMIIRVRGRACTNCKAGMTG